VKITLTGQKVEARSAAFLFVLLQPELILYPTSLLRI
jgi:hypothetical protein